MKYCPSYKRRVKNVEVGDSRSSELINNATAAQPILSGTPGDSHNTAAPIDSPETTDNNCASPVTNTSIGNCEDTPDHATSQPHLQPPSAGTATVASTIPDSLIDPVLRNLSHNRTVSGLSSQVEECNSSQVSASQPVTPSRGSSPSSLRLLGSHDQLCSPAMSTSTYTSMSSSPFSTPSKPRRKRPTKADPCFGEVVGAYRGNRVLGKAILFPDYTSANPHSQAIRRTRQPTEERLKTKRQKTGQTNDSDLGINIPKVFYDRTRSLVTQLHDLAEITGSWVHFSAQHPTASQPFIHYTSKRLRSEGGELLDNLHQANHELYQSLMTARRCDTTQIAAQLAKATGKLAEVEADAQAKIAEATAAKEAAEKATAELREMMIAAGVPVPNIPTQ
ncbi:hypothetical protein VNI00_016772 [Paramarasmius palmivorus]|uniref:Uncharacterized protein n=1 Tax=Paramarasmius palmivorus TaxID=297713 RepID=A0AAW0BC65_9AGAR